MMYLATCRYRKVAFSKFLGCHAGCMMCPTRRCKACDLAVMREMRQGRRSSKQKPSFLFAAYTIQMWAKPMDRSTNAASHRYFGARPQRILGLERNYFLAAGSLQMRKIASEEGRLLGKRKSRATHLASSTGGFRKL